LNEYPGLAKFAAGTAPDGGLNIPLACIPDHPIGVAGNEIDITYLP
jgi:hypothetical protein